MYLFDSQLTADEVLRAYHHDEPFLFLGAAFITVAIVSAAVCVIRRRFDPLLVNFALFAYLYGQRLRLDSAILHFGTSHNLFLSHLRGALTFLVPIPAFGFFEAAGFVGRRGKFILYAASAILLGLIVGSLIFGPMKVFDYINNSVVIVSLLAVLFQSFRRSVIEQNGGERDAAVLRAGLLCFMAGALWDNVVGFFQPPSRVEPYGFALFLIALGYVAARRASRRDQELAEIQSELNLARNIQLSILPASFPESAAFRVAARYVPMTSVAGDFYDFLVANDREAGLLIADVTGHGVPGALIASMVKMAALSQREHAANPGRVLTAMNAALCGHTQDQYVTAACVHLDAVSATLHYSAAGHPPMLLLRENEVTEIAENGFILAAYIHSEFATAAHALLPGDRLMLYTDGLIEAANAQREFFGENRLFAALRETAQLNTSGAADRIIALVQQWAKSQEDDLTLLLCDYRPGAA